jgi:hypothetical protein
MEDVVYFMDIWYILLPFDIFLGHLVYFMVIWYICGDLIYFVVIWYIL